MNQLNMKKWLMTGTILFIVLGLATPLFGQPKFKQAFKKKVVIQPRSSRPDLKVTSVTYSPNPFKAPGMISFKVTVKNIGTGPTSAICSLTMACYSTDSNWQRIGGKDHNLNLIPAYQNNIPILPAGQKIVIHKATSLHYIGPHEISGVINTESLQMGEESDNQNNEWRFRFTALPRPAPADLVLMFVGKTAQGQIKLTMKNKGRSIPSNDFNQAYIRLKVNNDQPRYVKLNEADPNGWLRKGKGLGFGQPKKVIFIWPTTYPNGVTLTPGQSYQVEVLLDHSVKITDSNRSNNLKSVTF